MKKTVINLAIFYFLVGIAIPSIGEEVINVSNIINKLEITRTVGGVRPQLSLYLNFPCNNAKVTNDMLDQLNNLGKALQHETLKTYIYSIEGHTCDLGSSEYNLQLSKHRAISVRDFLVSHFGMSKDQFLVESYGESRPLIENTNENARKKNRRVVIQNTSKIFKIDERPIILEILYNKNNKVLKLDKCQVLTSEDNYSIKFNNKSKNYIYIFQSDSNDNIDMLFPNSKISIHKNPLLPGTYRIPDNNNWLFLDNVNYGQEQIILFAHSKELKEPFNICAQILKENPVDSCEQFRGFKGIRSGFATEKFQKKIEIDYVSIHRFMHN